MKILFFGSSSYSLPILETLQKNFTVAAAITKPQGITKDFANKNNIPVFTPSTKAELQALKEQLAAFHSDLAIVSDFGIIIPKEIFEIPKVTTLNIHFSKLPKLRGASPVQYTLLYGEKFAWISIIVMDEGLDTGDIIWQKEISLTGDETTKSLYEKLFNITADSLTGILKEYVAGKIKPQRQNHSDATYTRILTRDDGFIPWNFLKAGLDGKKIDNSSQSEWELNDIVCQSLENCSIVSLAIDRAYRALYPWPGLWTNVALNGSSKRLKILNLHVDDNKLILDEVQLEGKKPVSWKQFRDGYSRLLI